MRNYLPKKTISRYSILLCLHLVQLVATAQQKPVFNSDSLFNKHADTATRQFRITQPYYIITWEGTVPENIQIIRRLDQQLAIIRVSDQKAVEYLDKKTTISAAGNHKQCLFHRKSCCLLRQ